MRIPVPIETLAEDRVRAVAPFPEVSAEGATEAEALRRLEEKLRPKTAFDSRVVWLEVDEHPLAKHAGKLKDNPLLEEWRATVEEYRKECDVHA